MYRNSDHSGDSEIFRDHVAFHFRKLSLPLMPKHFELQKAIQKVHWHIVNNLLEPNVTNIGGLQ